MSACAVVFGAGDMEMGGCVRVFGAGDTEEVGG